MAQEKPLKIDEGRIKEFSNSDELPNQPDIIEVKELIGRVVKILVDTGIPVDDEKLLNLLK